MTERQPEMSDEVDKAPVQYVLVRSDLPVAVQMVHVGHACGESIRTAPISRRTVIRLMHAPAARRVSAACGDICQLAVNGMTAA